MKTPNELTNDETSKIFEEAKTFLDQINITYRNNDELLKIFNSARFIDIRCRADGREYYFEGNFIRWKIAELQNEVNKKWYKKLFNRLKTKK